jgi:hypothetical protein
MSASFFVLAVGILSQIIFKLLVERIGVDNIIYAYK